MKIPFGILVIVALISITACQVQANASDPISIPPSAASTYPTPTATRPAKQTATLPVNHQPTSTLNPATTSTKLPSNVSTPTPLACLQRGGRIEEGSLSTKLLRLPLDFRVYLPPCYAEQPERRYPVLYLIHGQSYNDDQWDRLGADETADRLIASGQVSPFIIVMPHDRYGNQVEPGDFGQALIDALIPWVDRHYRTIPERLSRAVGGLSRGGGWSVDLGIGHWQYFGALGAHSPAIFPDGARNLRRWLQEIPRGYTPRIYIDVGDKDLPEIFDAATWFEDILNQMGIPHEWHLFTGFHNEEYWKNHLEGYLRWYASDW